MWDSMLIFFSVFVKVFTTSYLVDLAVYKTFLLLSEKLWKNDFSL